MCLLRQGSRSGHYVEVRFAWHAKAKPQAKGCRSSKQKHQSLLGSAGWRAFHERGGGHCFAELNSCYEETREHVHQPDDGSCWSGCQRLDSRGQQSSSQWGSGRGTERVIRLGGRGGESLISVNSHVRSSFRWRTSLLRMPYSLIGL